MERKNSLILERGRILLSHIYGTRIEIMSFSILIEDGNYIWKYVKVYFSDFAVHLSSLMTVQYDSIDEIIKRIIMKLSNILWLTHYVNLG